MNSDRIDAIYIMVEEQIIMLMDNGIDGTVVLNILLHALQNNI
jgi:hypothetical protein